MKTFLRIAAWSALILVVGGGAAYFLLPTSQLEVAKKRWQRLTHEPARICLDMYLDQMKDPTSVILGRSFVDNNRIVLFYRAKNGFGAYTEGTLDCPLKGNKVDDFGVTMEQHHKLMEEYGHQD